MTFVGWMVFEIEGLEGISGSEQIECLGDDILFLCRWRENQTRSYAVLVGQTKNKASFMH